MKTNEYMEQTEQYVLHTYNRFPLVIDHGEGVHLYDTDGKSISGLCGRYRGICARLQQ